MLKNFWLIFLFFASTGVLASQTYTPPPPPKLPRILSNELVKKGGFLFQKNYWVKDRLEIHNILGRNSCASCHDKKEKLIPKSLAKNFKNLRERINKEIRENSLGEELPNQSPMMDALVQYMVYRYRLREFKLSK